MSKIIQAKKEDVDQICQLFSEYDKDVEKNFSKKHLKLLQEHHPEHGDNSQRRRDILQAIDDKKELFLVAKDDEQVVGCIIGWIEQNTNVGKFDQLILSSQSKKKEIISKLYHELEKWFKSQKCPYVVVNVVVGNPRKKLYNNFGFEAVLEEMRKII